MGIGKLICKVGNVALMLEDIGGGYYFKLCIIDDSDNILNETKLNLDEAIFLERCLGITVDTIYSENVKRNLINGTEKQSS